MIQGTDIKAVEVGAVDVEAVEKVEKIVRRLKRIEGQVRGITKMVEDGKPCEDILIQIGSAKAALHKVGQRILERHLHHCVLNSIQNGAEKNSEEILDALYSALEQFSRLT